MNYKIIFRFLAILLLIICAFMLIPLFLTFYYNEKNTSISFIIPIIITFLLSLAVIYFTRRKRRKIKFTTRDGFLLVTLSWIFASMLGALPFCISGSIPSYVDAYFETMSGFTTTGATILTKIEIIPKSILFWRSLTHWLGGMGIVVLTVAILPLLGIGGLKLLQAEAPGPEVDKITPKITGTAKSLWFAYVGLSLLETILLIFGGMDLYDALTHTFGTMATGGFSPKNASIAFYSNPYIHVVITTFMILAGANFILYFQLITGKIKKILNNTELKAYIGIFSAATLLITLSLFNSGVYNTFGRCLRYAGFQCASILTTTGYATADFAKWPYLGQVVLFLIMFVGGCSGSTGGGIKVIRFSILFKQGINSMKSFIHPRGVFTLKANKQPVRKNVLNAISGFFFLYIFMLFITTLVVASAGNDIITSISTALVTLGNIGPGFGKVGPVENYAHFPSYVKWFLSFIMMAGRLELYTVLIIFMPTFWKK